MENKEVYLDYEQHLTKRVKNLLGEEAFRPLLCKIIHDVDLLFEIRKGFPIVYYMGGKIIEIKPYYNKELHLSIDSKYAMEDKENKELLEGLNDQPANYCFWEANLDDIKKCIEKFHKKYHNEERQKQQRIAKENNDFARDVVILDTEYGVREKRDTNSKLCKIDLTGVCKNKGGLYDILLIELKVGDGAITGNAGVGVHIDDFAVILGSRKEDLVKSINNIYQIKKDCGLLKNCPSDLKLSGEFRVVVLAYDLKKKKDDYKKERNKIPTQMDGYTLNLVLSPDNADELKMGVLFG